MYTNTKIYVLSPLARAITLTYTMYTQYSYYVIPEYDVMPSHDAYSRAMTHNLEPISHRLRSSR